jgi:hypothetical protein
VSCAFTSSFQSSRSSAPFSTWSPSFTGNVAIWPPSAGESRARWHASTVPARVLATVADTGPRPTVATVTATGFARVNHHAAPATTSNAITMTAIRFIGKQALG